MALRFATPQDAPSLLAVYAPYVEGTTVSFEFSVPSVREFARRIEETAQRYPYLLWEAEGRVVGYACAHQLLPRPAYQWAAELTVYLEEGAAGCGLGRRLYGALCDLLRLQGVRTVYGCVTAENAPSVAFHRALGFREAGRFPAAGHKLGRWLDVLWLEKTIAPVDAAPAPFLPFLQVDPEAAAQVLQRWGGGGIATAG